MSPTTRKRFGYSTLLLLFGALVVAVMVSNTWVRGVRIDLTEDNRYTRGDGTTLFSREQRDRADWKKAAEALESICGYPRLKYETP
jgi:hypothetical protein